MATPKKGSAPVNQLPAAQRMLEDQRLLLTGLRVSDSDAGDSTLTVTLSVTQGQLLVDHGIAKAYGNDGRSVTLTGNLSQLNAALGAVTYTPPAGYAGTVTLTMTTSDLGNTSDEAQSDTDSLSITVQAVNDAPTTSDRLVTTQEDRALVFKAADFGFSDSDGHALAAVRIGSLPGEGRLLYKGKVVTAQQIAQGFEVSAADLAAGRLTFTPTKDAHGEAYASILFQVRDTGGRTNGGQDTSEVRTLTVQVTPVNDAPIAGNDSAFASPVLAAQGRVLGNDRDVEGDRLSVTGVALGAESTKAQALQSVPSNSQGTTLAGKYGTLTLAADGSYTYQVNANSTAYRALKGKSATESFTYEVSDGQGGFDKATLAIKVTAPNQGPVARDDSSVVPSNTVSGKVLSNDTDADKDKLVVSGVATGTEEHNLGQALQPITAQALNGIYGRLTLRDDGSYSYIVDTKGAAYVALGRDVTGTDSFTYEVSDGRGGFDRATINITVKGVNDATVAKDDVGYAFSPYDIYDDESSNVLFNDSDLDTSDRERLVVSKVGAGVQVSQLVLNVEGQPETVINGQYGQLSMRADGYYSYRTDPSKAAFRDLASDGTYSEVFSYEVIDGRGGSSKAQITVYFPGPSAAPEARDDTATSGNVLTNDRDSDGDELRVFAAGVGSETANAGNALSQITSTDASGGSLTLTGTYGTLTIQQNGTYAYTLSPTDADYRALGQNTSATDSFTYEITDGIGGDRATIAIAVTGINDAPEAENDTTLLGKTDTRASGNVLTNDTDIDSGESATLKVTGLSSTMLGTTTSSSITIPTGSTGASLTGTFGTLTLKADGSYSYALDGDDADYRKLLEDQTATDTFTYTITDAQGATDTATLKVTVTGNNNPPVATDDDNEATLTVGSSQTAVLTTTTGNVLTNDTDANNDTLSVSQAGKGKESATPTLTTLSDHDSSAQTLKQVTLTGTYGSLLLKADGSYTYTLDSEGESYQALAKNTTATESFTYEVSDGKGGTDKATLTLNVGGINDAPVGVDDSATLLATDTGKTGNVLDNDTDVDTGDKALLKVTKAGSGTESGGQAATLTVLADSDSNPATPSTLTVQGRYGSLVINADGSYSYSINSSDADYQALAKDVTASEVFTYEVFDGKDGADKATLNLTVTGVNDAPVATDDSAELKPARQEAGTNVVVDLPASLSHNLSLTLDGGKTYTFTANASDAIYFSISDNANYMDGKVGKSISFELTVPGTGPKSYTISANTTASAPFILSYATTSAPIDEPAELSKSGNVLTNDTDADTGEKALLKVTKAGAGSEDDEGTLSTLAVPSEPDNGTSSNTSNTNSTTTNGTSPTATLTVAGAYGSLVINADGSYTYTLDSEGEAYLALPAGSTPTDNFTYVVADPSGGSDTATLAIKVNGINDAPVANDDTVSEVVTAADAVETVTSNGLTAANATRVLSGFDGGDAYVFALPATAGITHTYTVNGSANSLLLLAVKADYPMGGVRTLDSASGSGTDRTISHANVSGLAPGESLILVVFVATNSVPDFSLTSGSGSTTTQRVVPPLTGDVLENDTDVDLNDTLTVTGVRTGIEDDESNSLELTSLSGATTGVSITGTYGTLILEADGDYSYALDPQNAHYQALKGGDTVTESFTYEITDSHGATDQATLKFTVEGVNDAPVATDDSAELKAAGELPPISEKSVLLDNVDLTLSQQSNYAVSLTLKAGHTYTYTLTAGAMPDGFLGLYGANGTELAYVLSNDEILNGKRVVMLTYTVPGSDNLNVSLKYGTGATATKGSLEQLDEFSAGPAVAELSKSGNVLTNDTDADTGEKALLKVTKAGAGSEDDEGTLSMLTVPSTPDNGTSSNTSNTSSTTTNGTSPAATLTVAGTYGSLVINADGSYTYTLDSEGEAYLALPAGSTPTDNFTYVVADPSGGSDTATLAIKVNGINDAPVANDDTVDEVLTVDGLNLQITEVTLTAADADTALTIPNDNPNSVITSNGFLIPTAVGSTHTYTVTSAVPVPAVFFVALKGAYGSGIPRLLSSLDFRPSESVTLTFTNTHGLEPGESMYIGVNAYHYNSDFMLTGVNANASVAPAIGNVLENDSDIDTDDTFTVTGVRTGAESDTVAVPEATTTNAPTLTTVPSGMTGVSIAGTYGTLTLKADGSYSYALNPLDAEYRALVKNETASESFTYEIQDAQGARDQATLKFTVKGVNDAPVAKDDSAELKAGGGVTTLKDKESLIDEPPFNLKNNKSLELTLEPGHTYTFEASADSKLGIALLINGDTIQSVKGAEPTLTYTHTGETSVLATLVQSNDSGNASINYTLQLTETAESVAELTKSGNVLTNDTDVDTGDKALLKVTQAGAGTMDDEGTLTVQGTYGDVVINADGSYTYTLDTTDTDYIALGKGSSAIESFTYVVSDVQGASDTATLAIKVNGVNDAPDAENDINTTVLSASNLVVSQGVGEPAVTPQLGKLLKVDLVASTTELDSTASVALTMGSHDVAIADQLQIIKSLSDVPLDRVRVVLTNAKPGDVFTYHGETLTTGLTLSSGIELSVSELEGSLELMVSSSHGASDAAHVEVLQQIRFGSTETYPDTTPRLIEIIAEQASGHRASAVVTVGIEHVVPATGNVLDNDIDPDTGDTLAVTSATLTGSYGTLTLKADGSYGYTLNAADPDYIALPQDITATDTFTYTVSDSNGDSSTATLSLTVKGINDAPVGKDDSAALAPAKLQDATETALSYVLPAESSKTGNLLTNDTDADPGAGDTATHTITHAALGSEGSTPTATFSALTDHDSNASTAAQVTLVGQHGTLVLLADGNYTYTLNANDPDYAALGLNETLTDSFTYQVSDGSGGSDTATLTVSSQRTQAEPILRTGNINGENGFKVSGVAARDQTGRSVSGAGDLNNDGYDDFIIGALGADANGLVDTGAAFVVFGSGSLGSPSAAANLNLSDLTGSNGFRLNGLAAGDNLGISVSKAGDVNGDGFDDLIVGASGVDANGQTNSGTSYVLFGSSAMAPSGELALSSLDGGNGFRLIGAAASQERGRGVSAAGDVNGDGYDDLILSGAGFNPALVVLGGNSVGASGELALSPDKVFTLKLAGSTAVSGAGDVNGDGYDDLLVGLVPLRGAPSTYLVFGGNDLMPAGSITLGATSTSDYLVIGAVQGSGFGKAVSSAGDVNGDGYADLIIGAYGAESAYVVFGSNTPPVSGSKLLASSLNGSNGFVLSSRNSSGNFRFSVSSAGDFNGDGYDDLIVGDDGFSSSSIVFGGATMAASLSVGALNGLNGIVLAANSIDAGTLGVSVSSAGDINGDGFDDLVVGADSATVNGNKNAGAAFIIYGFATGNTGAATHALLTGTDSSETLNGGLGNDRLDGGAGNDVLIGGAGNDTLVYDAADTLRVDGGTGRDTLAITGSGVALNLTALNNFSDATTAPQSPYESIEIIDLTGMGNNTLQITPADLLRLTGAATGADGARDNHLLRVDGNAGDSVQLYPGVWTSAGLANGDGALISNGGYTLYTSGQARLLVANAVAVVEPNIAPEAVDDTDALAVAGTSEVLSGNQLFMSSGPSSSEAGSYTTSITLQPGREYQFTLGGGGGPNVAGNFALLAGSETLIATVNIGAGGQVLSYTHHGDEPLDATGVVQVTGGLFGYSITVSELLPVTATELETSGNVLTNDTDANDNTLTVTAAGSGPESSSTVNNRSTLAPGATVGTELTLHGQYGDLLIRGDGSYTYTLNTSDADYLGLLPGQRATDAFTYVVNDGNGGSDTATLSVQVTNTNGLRVLGASSLDFAGSAISRAGDFNSDGLEDFIIGAPDALNTFVGENELSSIKGGATYVVYGSSDLSLNGDLDLATLTSAQGFKFEGITPDGQVGRRVAALGDINGDGYEDVIVSAGAGNTADNASYVLLGGDRSGPNAGSANTYSVSTVGFELTGGEGFSARVTSVAGAGDLNGDGLNDVVIGVSGTNNNSGQTYVVFGSTTLGGNIDLNNLGSQGFAINGSAGEYSGDAITSAGDVNGDGYDDLLIGAPQIKDSVDTSVPAGGGYVVFGGAAVGAGGNLNLADLAAGNGSAGYRLQATNSNERAGSVVASAGDLNGDGYDDFIIGAPGANTYAGRAYVVFGSATTGVGNVTLASLNGSNGFVLNGSNSYGKFGTSVSSAGDFNGDGYADLLVSQPSAQINGVSTPATYLVFGGQTLGQGGTVNLAQLNARTGIRFADATHSGQGQQVSSAGDVNGDGFDDLMVSSPYSSVNGKSHAGSTSIVYGFASGADATTLKKGTAGADHLIGMAAAETLIGGLGDDILEGGAGNDVMIGGAGNDTLIYDAADTLKVDGGTGRDTLRVEGNDITLDFTALNSFKDSTQAPANPFESIEIIDLAGMNNTLRLGKVDMLRLMGTEPGAQRLLIVGEADDRVELTSGNWTPAMDEYDAEGIATVSGGYTLYTNGEARLLVASAVTVQLPPAQVAPVAFDDVGDQTLTAGETSDTEVSGNLLTNDTDINLDDTLTVNGLRAGAESASASFNAVSIDGASYAGTFGSVYLTADGAYTYSLNTSDADYKALAQGITASEVFTYVVSDGQGGSDTATLTLTVQGINDAPVGVDDSASLAVAQGQTPAETSKTGSVLTNDTDPDTGDKDLLSVSGVRTGLESATNPATLTSVSSSGATLTGTFGSLLLKADGTYTYTLDTTASAYTALSEGVTGTDSFTYEITDASGAKDKATLSMTVTGSAPSEPEFPLVQVTPKPVIQLSALNGTDGYKLSGSGATHRVGTVVTAAGDINGDGFDDFLTSASGENGNAYVVFGDKSGTSPANVNVTALNGTDGFIISANSRIAGAQFEGVGDMNGDGYDDVAFITQDITAPYALAYIVFGSSTLGSTGGLSLSSDTATSDYAVISHTSFENPGKISKAGDVNGDGLDDLILGRTGANQPQSHIIFGKTTLPGTVATAASLSSTTTGTGFRILVTPNAPGSVGDINGDGFDDVGESGYVVFGSAAPIHITNTSGIAGRGFTFTPNDIKTISSPGDVNGDGYDDIMMSRAGDVRVIFGGPTISASNTQNFTTLSPGTGFIITAPAAQTAMDTSGSAAGDINGDGYDDMLFGAVGSTQAVEIPGDAYVVFGGASIGSSSISLSSLNGENGFRLAGVGNTDVTGRYVKAVGDVNGDGFDDLLISAFNADPNGENSGASYLVYGFAAGNTSVLRLGTNGDDRMTGGADRDHFIGGLGNDRLDGGAGNDVLVGGAGNDTLIYDAADTLKVDGGNGRDILAILGSDVTLDLTALNNYATSAQAPRSPYESIEIIDLTGVGSNTLKLDARDLFSLVGSATGDDGLRDTNLLRVEGDANDMVTFTGGSWTNQGSRNGDGATGTGYTLYTDGQAQLLVASLITVDNSTMGT